MEAAYPACSAPGALPPTKAQKRPATQGQWLPLGEEARIQALQLPGLWAPPACCGLWKALGDSIITSVQVESAVSEGRAPGAPSDSVELAEPVWLRFRAQTLVCMVCPAGSWAGAGPRREDYRGTLVQNRFREATPGSP